jgi:poly-gamma-glutamate synthesis protein (capsule biosynthesis protein)
VVVSLHWGGNWGFGIPPAQRAFARRLVDAAGADIVWGHSSHHAKGIEVRNGKLILYGCGDLINDYEGIGGHGEYRPELSLMYFPEVDTATGDLLALRMAPMRMRRFRLERAPQDDADWLRGVLDREGRALGTRVEPGGDALLALAHG